MHKNFRDNILHDTTSLNLNRWMHFYSFNHLCTIVLGNFRFQFRWNELILVFWRQFGVLTSFWRNVGIRGSLMRKTLLNNFMSYKISFLKFFKQNSLNFLNYCRFSELTSFWVFNVIWRRHVKLGLFYLNALLYF